MAPPKYKTLFYLFTGNVGGVSMVDFYWFGLTVNLAPFLGLSVAYFMLQGPENGCNFGFC